MALGSVGGAFKRPIAKGNPSDHEDSSEEARVDEDESSWLNNTTTLIEDEREKDASKTDHDEVKSREPKGVDGDQAAEETDDADDDALNPEREY